MIKKVRNRARPMRIWLGGICWVPRAWRRKENTTTRRVKEVTIIMMAGARERTVRKRSIWRERLRRSGPSICSKLQGEAAKAGAAQKKITVRDAQTFFISRPSQG